VDRVQEMMQDPKRRRLIIGIGAGLVALVVVVVLVMALGGGSDDDEGSGSSVAGAASGGSGAVGASGSSGGGSGGGAAFCRDWPALSAAAAGAQTGGTGSAKAGFEQASAQFKALANSAPSEIRGDFKTYADAYAAFAVVLEKANYDVTKISATDMEKAIRTFSDPKVTTAGIKIGEWITKNCS
jgi:hypothetical protein